MQIIFDVIFLSFLTIILYAKFARSKENAKIDNINKRQITDDEFYLLKEFYRKRIFYFVIEIIVFVVLFLFILGLLIGDCTIEKITDMINGTSLDVSLVLEILMLLIFSLIIGCTANLNYKIYITLQNKNDIKVLEGFCVQTKSIVRKKNRKTVRYAVEITDAEDYSRIILNLRPEKDKFVIEKLINPNDRIFVYSLDNEAYIMIKNSLFFKTDLYMEQLYRQKVAKDKSKEIVIRN